MNVIYVYGLLWLISFIWLMYNSEGFHKHTNNFFPPAIWELFAFLSSFLLLGFFYMVRYGYKTAVWHIRAWITIWSVKRVVKKIAKKHGIKIDM